MFCKFFYSKLQSQGVKSLGFYGAQRRTPAVHKHALIMSNAYSHERHPNGLAQICGVSGRDRRKLFWT